ncbi:MAG TPA: MlaD family protein [Kiritimatiellia bacterium]|nr:MlaD family protein [Kiritimatiellia bacterium]HMO97970.1 MlaD family protein [Kiritimatiellia bacterium]HMP95321.1 MlaD family protein [Kiritimatiellia bacterium]
MKTKPFQFRYVNEIVGGFVLLVVVLLIAAVFVAGRAQGWFEPVHKIHIDFPPQGSLDLQIGSPVQILGTTVGRVEMIEVDDEGFMTGVITVKGDFYQFVRSDSRAIVKKKFGIAGDAYIEITKGIGPALPSGAGLVASKDTDLNELLEDLLSQVREAIVPLLDSVKLAADQYAGLAADLRADAGPLQMMLANLEGITRKLDQGEGPAGKLLADEALAETLRDIIAQVQAAMAQVNVMLTDLREVTIELPPMARTVNREVQDIPGTVLMTQETLRETERLIEGIQRHWLLRKYIPRTEPTPLISVFELRRPVGAAVGETQENNP